MSVAVDAARKLNVSGWRPNDTVKEHPHGSLVEHPHQRISALTGDTQLILRLTNESVDSLLAIREIAIEDKSTVSRLDLIENTVSTMRVEALEVATWCTQYEFPRHTTQAHRKRIVTVVATELRAPLSAAPTARGFFALFGLRLDPRTQVR
jgi:hypothetical protein